ncbi:saccharopine dehydrogenase family protein [Thermovenabulum gondwanense]|uniref:Lysine 6-dehydrogenase n=1 Tax=Thermovenabulum gondwanense TaxID=520767 RepID=A0A162MCQ0_9FIRM|nr:saccharopine dehydrogenase family protein [Thermovenabulum gondwanense]KYO65266.1 Lysine 6-dehydrogenase [Thermovenabulum gondwanense]
MKIIVLGAGLVGSLIARDLSRDFDVTVADRSEEALKRINELAGVGTLQIDFSKENAIKETVKDFDLVVGAVPGFLGFNMLKQVIEAKKNIVDISFAPEDCIVLDDLAKENNVTAVIDCGVAPGMSNILIGHVTKMLDETQYCEILVGGLPQSRYWPYEYKLVFSPLDTIDEYMRPARMKINGEIVEKPALSEIELVDFPPIGTLEAFNTDGLRSLLYTLNIPNMKEKTLRYPGHAEKMKMLRETGFFANDPVEVNGVKVKPIELTAKLLFPMWKLKDGEKDFTIMRVTVKGKKDGEMISYIYDLVDYFDDVMKVTSMARTTGYTCSVVVRLLAKGLYDKKGVCPPEYLGMEDRVFEEILKGLREKGVIYNESIVKS